MGQHWVRSKEWKILGFGTSSGVVADGAKEGAGG